MKTTPHIHSELKKWFEDRDIDYGLTDTYIGHLAKFIEEKITLSKKEAKEEVVREIYQKQMEWEALTIGAQLVKDGLVSEIEAYAKQQGISINNE